MPRNAYQSNVRGTGDSDGPVPTAVSTGDIEMRYIATAGLLLLATGIAAAWNVQLLDFQGQRSAVTVDLDRQSDPPALVARFRGTHDLHYYARSETAPAPGLQLKVSADSPQAKIGPAVFPEWKMFYDKGQAKDIEVYVGDFDIRLPITSMPRDKPFPARVTIEGIACTSQVCLPPFTETLALQIDPATGTVTLVEEAASDNGASGPAESSAGSPAPGPETQPEPSDNQANPLAQALTDWTENATGTTDQPVIVYLLLAVLAGLSINIMPCVLPVLPLLIMRLVAQGKESPRRRLALGAAFCLGIVGFFALFAVIAVAVRVTTGAVIDLNELFRTPAAVIALFLLIVFFALVFLDVVTLTLPASVSTGQPQRPGAAGSIGMGFFAGLLSTPCSGALLGVVVVWAQTQPPIVGAAALVLMGVGMALPYAVLTLVPAWLDRLPKPGPWMDIVKKAGGFLLLAIAVKFALAALDKQRLIDVAMYAVVFSFCVWMWGRWVTYATPRARKWTVRLAAVLLAVAFGWWLLPAAPPSAIDWQPYDRARIAQALAEGRGVVIKFTADWCTNCKVVERRVYRDPTVVSLIKRKGLLAVKADTTERGWPATVDLDAVFGEAGTVPLTVVLDPTKRGYVKLRGIFSPQRFIEAAEQLPDRRPPSARQPTREVQGRT